jgi:hypothetical protein
VAGDGEAVALDAPRELGDVTLRILDLARVLPLGWVVLGTVEARERPRDALGEPRGTGSPRALLQLDPGLLEVAHPNSFHAIANEWLFVGARGIPVASTRLAEVLQNAPARA